MKAAGDGPRRQTCLRHARLRPEGSRGADRRRRPGRRRSAAARGARTPEEPCGLRSPSTLSQTAHPNRAACPAPPARLKSVYVTANSSSRPCPSPSRAPHQRAPPGYWFPRPAVRYSFADSRLCCSCTSRRSLYVDERRWVETADQRNGGRNG